MRKWYQKSMAVLTAAACLFAGGTIGLARNSLLQLQLTAEAEDKIYTGESDGLQLEYEELEDGTVEITRFVSSTSTDIELPSVIDGKSVTSIGKSAFDANNIEACRNLTSIIIPDNVTSIGYGAFHGCASLTDVTIPDSVTSIGDSAFVGCSSLTEIIVSSGNESYSSKDGALFDKNLETIICCPGRKTGDFIIPDSVTSIGGLAFESCTSLTNVIIPDSVTSIGESAFSWCTGLTNVTIPDNVTNIGMLAFYKCTSLTDITIPKSVTSIGDFTFLHCDNLTDIYYSGTESKWNQISDNSAIPSDVTIHYTSTIGSLAIKKVEVTLDELQANDYMVTVPVTINNNDNTYITG